jgi:hypothetical protein
MDDHEINKTIDEFLYNVRPLDLLVFKSGDNVSKLIRYLQKIKTGSGSISHTELAISKRYCPEIRTLEKNPNLDKLYSWGSTMSGPLNDGVYNAETGESAFGVQIRSLKELARSYLENKGANIGVCKLLINPIDFNYGYPLYENITYENSEESAQNEFDNRIKKLKSDLSKTYLKYYNVNYDANLLSLFASIFPKLRIFRNKTEIMIGKFTNIDKWIFCSQLVCLIYKEIGIIDYYVDDRNVLPVDFLGFEADKDGISDPICNTNPQWIK